jgi:integrase
LSPETGKNRPYPIGPYPAVSLKDARKRAAGLLKQITKGIDPREEETREKARKAARDKGTLGALLDLNLERLRKEGKDRYADRVAQDIKLNIPTDTLAAPADSILEQDIVDLMDAIVDRAQARGFTGERSADYLKTYISAAYEFVLTARGTKWASKAKPFSHLTANPALRIKKYQSSAGVGQRTINPDEFVTLYKTVGVEAMQADLALYIKLAFHLGGQRVEELLWAPWSEFDIEGGTWSIPIERRKIRSKAKHQEPHLVPITKTAAALLRELHDLTGHTPWLFPTQAGETAGEDPRTTPALNQAIRRYCVPGAESKRQPFERFTPRDIRRSVKTLMGQAGLSKEIRDRIQGHAFSDVGSVHYDRFDYLSEKQNAMRKWERWLNGKVKPGKAKVVQLRGK